MRSFINCFLGALGVLLAIKFYMWFDFDMVAPAIESLQEMLKKFNPAHRPFT